MNTRVPLKNEIVPPFFSYVPTVSCNMKEDVAFRLQQAEKLGLGFELPAQTTYVVRIVRENEATLKFENAA